MSKPGSRMHSRRAWVARRRARGLCLTCPAAWTGPSQKCPDCKAKERARWRAKAKRPEDRQARQAAWAGMDWSQPNTVIARAMGVSVNAVTYQRHKAGRSYGKRGRPKKIR